MTGGLGSRWVDALGAMVDGGADLVEVGLPFSDPVMDGPTIQEASVRALAAGATPGGILDALRPLEVPVPLVAMTYYNLVFRAGHARFAHCWSRAGCAAPSFRPSPRGVSRVGSRGRRGRGGHRAAGSPGHARRPPRRAVPAVTRFRVRGQRHGRDRRTESLAQSATVLAKRLKAATDKPVSWASGSRRRAGGGGGDRGRTGWWWPPP